MSMRINQLLLTVTLLTASCQNEDSTKPVQQVNIDTIKENNPIVSVSKPTVPLEIYSFPEFWRKFRIAVLNSDSIQLITMTTFPFKTHGPLDDDPMVEYKKEKFATVFQAFLKQNSGLNLEGGTELEEIKKATKPKEKDVDGNYARVGDLVFNKNNEGWKLTLAYLNNETIDLLRK